MAFTDALTRPAQLTPQQLVAAALAARSAPAAATPRGFAILGGGEIGGATPASIAAQRAVADALANGGPPRTLGEGIASLGNAIAYRAINNRADAAQKAGQASVNQDVADLYAGGGDASAKSISSASSYMPGNPSSDDAPQIGDFSASPLAAPPNSATPDLVDFTEGQEGFTPTAKPDGSQWSDGYGTKATPAEMAGQPISQAAATARLQQELGTADNYVSSLPGADKLNPNQREALDDAAYNLGSFGSGLTDDIASGNLADVPAHLAQYTGSWSPANQAGLTNRRQAEIGLWNTQPGNGAAPAPVPAPGAPIDAEAGLASADPNGPAPTLAPPQSGVSPAVANVASALQSIQGGSTASGGPIQPSPAVAQVAQALAAAQAGNTGGTAPQPVTTGAASGPPSPGVAAVASAMGALPAASAAKAVPAASAAPAIPQIPQAQLAAAQRILSNPFATPAQQAQATAVLQRAQQQSDPAYQLDLQTKEAALNNAQNPPLSIQTMSDGTVIGINTRTGEVKPLYQGPAKTFKPLTDPDARAAAGISPDDQSPYQQGPDGRVYPIGGAANSTTGLVTQGAPATGDAIIRGDIPADKVAPYSSRTAPLYDYLAKQGFNLTQAQEDLQATKSRIGTVNSGPFLQQQSSIVLLNEQLPKLQTMAAQWNNGQYPDVNTVRGWLAGKGLGDVDPAKAQAAQSLYQQMTGLVADMQPELAKVYSGGNASTDAQLAHADQQLSTSWSLGTLTDMIKLAQSNLAVRQATLSAMQHGTGIYSSVGVASPFLSDGTPAPAGAPPAAGGAPAVAAPAATPAAAAGAPASAAPPPGILRVTPDGVGIPVGGFADAGPPPPGWPDPSTWKFVPPAARQQFLGAGGGQ